MFAVLWIMLLLAPMLSAQASPADTVAPADSGVTDDQVALRPGDVVRITIWREDDLSGDFSVDRDGIVVLPLLGEKQVTGVPIARLRNTLLREYQLQLRNTSIQITPLRRINVLGEVKKPGLYEVDPTITLAGVVALAEGTTASGDLNQIRIFRDGEVIRQQAGAENTLEDVDIRSGDQVIVGQRNWFSRNSTFVVSLLLSVTGILIPLLTR